MSKQVIECDILSQIDLKRYKHDLDHIDLNNMKTECQQYTLAEELNFGFFTKELQEWTRDWSYKKADHIKNCNHEQCQKLLKYWKKDSLLSTYL